MILILSQDGKRKRSKTLKEGSLLGHGWQELQSQTAQLASVSMGAVTKVTSVFRSVGKTSVNRAHLMSLMFVH